MKEIYLDHAATAPMLNEAVEAMIPAMQETFGNPSSVHRFGRKARQRLDEARRTAAASIGADEKEIIFTSGGTEADNLALIGAAFANQDKGNHIIISEIEHHAILHAADYLRKHGFRVTLLPVDETGIVSLSRLKKELSDETILISVMTVNNEVGTIQPIKEIGELLEGHQASFHTDAVQAFGMLKINVDELKVDMLTVSSHKIGGPKGVGFLYARKGQKLQILQHGGQQERKRRAGTENLAGIIGFERAIEVLTEERTNRNEKYSNYKSEFLSGLEAHHVDFSLNGDNHQTLPSIVNISFPGTSVEALLMNFDLDGIAASSGSACTAGSVEPSHVLSAMYGSEDDRTVNSIRFSFGEANSVEDIEEAVARIGKIIHRLVK